jgi:hypothetical protein
MLFPVNNCITKIGEWGTGNYLDVVVQNNYAYCAAGYAGLDIIDITSASLPKKIGNYNTPGQATKVFVMGNYAYVADSREGLQVIDVSNPYSPTLAGHGIIIRIIGGPKPCMSEESMLMLPVLMKG